MNPLDLAKPKPKSNGKTVEAFIPTATEERNMNLVEMGVGTVCFDEVVYENVFVLVKEYAHKTLRKDTRYYAKVILCI
jgi:hypothetical protein